MKDPTQTGLPLGGPRSALFLRNLGNIPAGELAHIQETLFWTTESESRGGFTVLDKGEVPSKKSQLLLLNIQGFSRSDWVGTMVELEEQGHNVGGYAKTTDMDEAAGLMETSPYPLVIDLEDSPYPIQSTLGLMAMGVNGVIINLGPAAAVGTITPDQWKDFFPRVKSLVFSLERELVRPLAPIRDAKPLSQEEKLRSVAFQGERGAYSELAVFSLFDRTQARAVPNKSFRDVYEAVLKGEVDYGLLPFENALAGPIQDNFDLMLQYPDLHIIAETQIRIEHNLIGLPGADLEQVRRVFSHPQGLAQSAAFLDRHPEWERVPFYDTAGSVAHIAREKDPSLAAIASAVAADFYEMQILVAGVETNPRNYTRFALIAPLKVPPLEPPTKASLVFSTAHSPGALSRCLAILSAHRLNMRKIESRPIHGKPWSYMFYVDVELPEEPEAFDRARAELEDQTKEFRILGLYPSKNQ